ncbi:hypothetical protein CLOSTASPAR_01045 [[Clostridium] asparagiforme DSM 15981]|uniref:Uncharacterized protein n=1 Tax=[Clostridium] asparagiforme DSM 15981 TaxID=518636 RepID=C0CVP2_9FIRM|nr:hypothetical protein CLOSTASPAR_01045 [[Clostridium] asparagiforme DSM 15981]
MLSFRKNQSLSFIARGDSILEIIRILLKFFVVGRLFLLISMNVILPLDLNLSIIMIAFVNIR